jgi:DNA-binding beta-propeller fold protein YncE
MLGNLLSPCRLRVIPGSAMRHQYLIAMFWLTPAALISSYCVAEAQGGYFLVANMASNEVLQFDATSYSFVRVFASGGLLNRPSALAYGPDGNLYVANGSSHNVLRYNGMTGEFIDVFASGGGLSYPAGLVFGPDGNLYVSGQGSDNVVRYNGQTGEFIDEFVDVYQAPGGLAFGPDGHLYLCVVLSSAVMRFDGTTGHYLNTIVDVSNGAPEGMAFGPDGDLYVTCSAGAVNRYDVETRTLVKRFSAGNDLDFALGVAFDPVGDLLVTGFWSNTVVRFDVDSGHVISVIDQGLLHEPSAIVFVQQVPEPSSLVILAGIAAFSLACRRRR